MPIHKFELMHGAVLTKLCRNDQPIALSLIETRNEQRAVYWVNDEVVLYIKHSTTPRDTEQRRVSTSWRFTFYPEHIALIAQYRTVTYLALVCARADQSGEICLLHPDEIERCLDLNSRETQQWLAVEAEPRQRLRAFGRLNSSEKLVIARDRLDKWQVPGR